MVTSPTASFRRDSTAARNHVARPFVNAAPMPAHGYRHDDVSTNNPREAAESCLLSNMIGITLLRVVKS
jgi:hypothetical protein